MLGFIAFILLAAFLSYRLIEVPMRKFINKNGDDVLFLFFFTFLNLLFMKTIKQIFLILLVSTLSFTVYAQQQKKATPSIKYGDNAKAGKYFSTGGIKLYYETSVVIR